MVGFIADLHLDISRGKNNFYEFIEQSINEFIKLSINKNVSDVILLGDLFHAKDHISSEALCRSNELIFKLSKHFKIHILVGNHDLILKTNHSINLADIYKYFNNVKVYSSYEKIEIDNQVFHISPYIENGLLLNEFLNNVKYDKNKKNILCSHFGVHGFTLHESANQYGFIDKNSDIKPDKFTNFDYVFLGHYHGYQTNGKITYVSSPFQSKHGDEYSKHGFVFYDGDNFEFIENQYSPIFVTKVFNKKNIKDLIENYKNSYINIVLEKNYTHTVLQNIKEILLKNNIDVEYKNNINNNINHVAIKNWQKINYINTEELINNFISYLEVNNLIELPDEKDKIIKFMFSEKFL